MAIARINDQFISYETAGVADFRLRTPALMLHGNGESRKVFSRVVPLLSGSRGFVLMDSRYQGASKPVNEDEPPHITYELMADDAIKLMENELGIGEYDIIGASDGAITALYMALRSIRVRKLILIGVNSDPGGLKHRMVRLIKKDLADAKLRKNAVEAALLKLMLEEPKLTNNDLASVICETTVIHGEKDEAIRIGHASAIADAIPRGSFVVVKDSGHNVELDQPEALANLIRSLL